MSNMALEVSDMQLEPGSMAQQPHAACKLKAYVEGPSLQLTALEKTT